MNDRRFDVVVVGGGINGVGVAQAAAAAGHSVLLLEKKGLASGTSSRSSKLIHGGLRYLETLELRLVHEGLRERALMLELAPDLVKLTPFHVPIYRSTRRRPWLIRTGLSLYALLGNLRKQVRFETVGRGGWGDLDGLATDGLDAVFRYWDAQTDDRALTIAVMNSARGLGAELAMPAELTAARLTAEGAVVHYIEGGKERSCETRVLVNAAGPWVNQLQDRIESAPAARPIELVQGTHLVVPGRPERGIYYVEAPRDGRAVFIMPWKGNTLVGTTETRYRGDPDFVQPRRAERKYLLNVLRRYFPRYAANGPVPVLEAFAGLRVLPAGPGHAFHRSRETILDVDRTNRTERPRLLSIYGGKLTSWRATAEKVIERLAPALPDRQPRADTRRLHLEPP